EIVFSQVQRSASQGVQKRNTVLFRYIGGEALVFLACFLLGPSDERRYARHDQHMIRVAPIGRDARLYITVELLGGIQSLMCGEYHLCGRSGQFPSIFGLSGLDNDRMTLRRAGNV